MSYLYKALLKEKQQQAGTQQPAQPTEPANPYAANISTSATNHAGFYGSETKASINWLAWLTIGILLLIVGLLAGYILGQTANNQPNLQAHLSQNNSDLAVTSEPTTAVTEQQVHSKQQNLSERSDLTENTVSTEQQVSADLATPVEQQVTNDESAVSRNAVAEEETTTTEELSDPVVIRLSDLTNNDATLDDVPEELQNQFAQALNELNAEQDVNSNNVEQGDIETVEQATNADNASYIETSSTLTDINDLSPVDRALVPKMVYEMHIYSSEPRERWIRVNGQTLYEGDDFTQYIRLVEIRQDSIVWETQYQRFTQQALSDYK